MASSAAECTCSDSTLQKTFNTVRGFRSSPLTRQSGKKLSATEWVKVRVDLLIDSLRRITPHFALGYVERLLSNTKVERHLAKHHGEILNEFKKSIREKVEEMSSALPDRMK
jgi:hypothetical protein